MEDIAESVVPDTPGLETAINLIQKGKRFTSKYINDECVQRKLLSNDLDEPVAPMLPALLDYLLNPLKGLKDWDTIDWLKWLVSGGMSPLDFYASVRNFDNSTTCGLVWTANFVAYRCRTCSVSPCMSICSECFKNGNHDKHDFNMFKSQAGGACDCGNAAVMKEIGFCTRHGSHATSRKDVPVNLLTSAEAVLPRIFLRFILHCRSYSRSTSSDIQKAMDEAEPLIDYLQDLTTLGGPMRINIRKALCNPIYYKESLNPNPQQEAYEELILCRDNYFNAMNSLPSVDVPRGFEDVSGMMGPLVHETFLDEIVFWTVKFEFPQKLVCFLLNMRPDPVYEEAFAKAFVQHYSRMSKMLVTSGDSDTLSNSVVHVSVQLFSDQHLAFRMTDSFHLLHIIVLSIKNMMDFILIPSTIHESRNNRHMVVDCSHTIMKNHCYWPLVSDLNNILSHKPIVEKFMGDERLVRLWYNFLSLFQGMNVNVREQHQHVEYEPQSYYASFSAESEISGSPMWTTVSHLKDAETKHFSLLAIKESLAVLSRWFEDIAFYDQSQVTTPNHLSFHLPLHRNYALFLCQAVKLQGVHLEDVMPPLPLLQKICYHPLRNMAAISEIVNGLWVRNGLQIKGQVITYLQCHFCNSMVDLDIFLLQLGACELNPNAFLNNVLERFVVLDTLSLGKKSSHNGEWVNDCEMKIALLESCLNFLGILTSARTYIGAEDIDISRLEMATLLCMADRTHSQLLDSMPEKSSSGTQNRNFEAVLKQVASYKAPMYDSNGAMTQGMYCPKDESWENIYDPIYSALRAVQKKDYQNSLDRYKFYCQKTRKLNYNMINLWPPYRLPGSLNPSFKDPRKLIACRTFHAVLLTLLFNSVYNPSFTESLMSLTIYLLELVIEYQLTIVQEGGEMMATSRNSTSSEMYSNVEPCDGVFESWFQTDDIFFNSTVIIDQIHLESPSTSVTSDKSLEVALALTTSSEMVTVDEGGVSEMETTEALPVAQPSVLPPRQLPVLLAGTEVARRHAQMSQDIARSSADSYPPRSRRHTGPANKALPSTEESSGFDLSQFTAHLPLNSGEEYFPINESIISLLLKLHTKLSGTAGSYKPDFSVPNGNCRIGDGPFFIDKVLNKMGKYNEDAKRCIERTRMHLYPRCGDGENSEDERAARAERKRKAKERQKKVMNQFKERQKKFIENVDPLIFKKAEEDSRMDQEHPIIEYECVICNMCIPSTAQKPVGLIVLIQATSVLGHKLGVNHPFDLPTSETEYSDIRMNRLTLAKYIEEWAESLKVFFNLDSCLLSMNNGWEGGVHVQTCGHHIHLACHRSYLESLRRGLRQPQNLKHELGEFMCPFCRQLANGIIPITPETGKNSTIVRHPSNCEENIEELIDTLLKELSVPMFGVEITQAMAKLMENLTVATHSKYRTMATNPSACSLFVFVSSIIRTNLETELVQRGGSLINQKADAKRDIRTSGLLALLHTLSFHSKILSGGGDLSGLDIDRPIHWIRQLWASVTSTYVDNCATNITLVDRDVPMIFRDPVTILLQLILLLPSGLEESFFKCILNHLYQLVIVRAVLAVLCSMGEKDGKMIMEEGPWADLFFLVYCDMRSAPIFANDSISAGKQWTVDSANCEIRESCLDFLRIASLLMSCIREQRLPFIEEPVEECGVLEQYIGVWDRSSVVNTSINYKMCNVKARQTGTLVHPCNIWGSQVTHFAMRAQISASKFIIYKRFFKPRLLKLPNTYDAVFQFYHVKHCSKCHSSPKDPAVCLICGTMVCLREQCCKSQEVYEAVQHAIDCGGGTGIFLAISQSTVIVVRGQRVCLWGCIHLDANGEEDRDLKRGKPLFLNEGRFNLLEKMWLNHSFDHAPRRWIWHREGF